MTAAYWWRGDDGNSRNFGDELTPLLLSHFAELDVEWSGPQEADIICCGSVLDVMPHAGWRGIVVGAGQLHESTVTNLKYATVLGLRGCLTNDRVGHSLNEQICLGDPGLLVSELATPIPNQFEIGCVPHLTDDELFPRELERAREYGYAEPHLIDVTKDPIQVITEIGSCRKVIASSLHGIVTADAWGLPRRAEPFPAMFLDPVHEGSRFKHDDYASAIGQPIHFGTLQTAPKIRVEQIQHDLFQMFATLKGLMNVQAPS